MKLGVANADLIDNWPYVMTKPAISAAWVAMASIRVSMSVYASVEYVLVAGMLRWMDGWMDGWMASCVVRACNGALMLHVSSLSRIRTMALT